jgi:hypothetical protein
MKINHGMTARSEFRLQAVWMVNRVLPPKGGTPNQFRRLRIIEFDFPHSALRIPHF